MCLCRSPPLYRKEMHIFIFCLTDWLYPVLLYACVIHKEAKIHKEFTQLVIQIESLHDDINFLQKSFLQGYEGLKNTQPKQHNLKLFIPIMALNDNYSKTILKMGQPQIYRRTSSNHYTHTVYSQLDIMFYP